MLDSPHGLRAVGVGPKIALTALPFLLLAILAVVLWPGLAELPVPPVAARVLGVAWLVAGLALYGATVRTFLRDFPKGKLITTGPYGLCRHPLYASVALGVLPAISLLTVSWVFFVVALVVLAAASRLCPQEEADLERIFGAEYRAYRERVRMFLPLPRRGADARRTFHGGAHA
jgi:protein-S-isoprenylcysteine O-methyltransferase Ste14